MDFDQNAIRSRGHCRFRHRCHQIPLAGGMAGIDDDGQMRKLLTCRDCGEIERVAICVSKVLIPRSHNMTF